MSESRAATTRAEGSGTKFRPGDGVELTAVPKSSGLHLGMRGTVVSVDNVAKVVSVELDGENGSGGGGGGGEGGGGREVIVPGEYLAHLVPGAEYKPGWWPYEPTAEQRKDFATWAKFGLTADEHGVDMPPAWQREWEEENACGGWCCYSFECGAISCDLCAKTAVWPRCPECGRAFRRSSSAGEKCKCGASLEGDVLRFRTR